MNNLDRYEDSQIWADEHRREYEIDKDPGAEPIHDHHYSFDALLDAANRLLTAKKLLLPLGPTQNIRMAILEAKEAVAILDGIEFKQKQDQA